MTDMAASEDDYYRKMLEVNGEAVGGVDKLIAEMERIAQKQVAKPRDGVRVYEPTRDKADLILKDGSLITPRERVGQGAVNIDPTQLEYAVN